MEPIYKHDCEKCRFLGTDIVRHPNERGANGVDMYVCEEALGGASLIRRYSSEGSEYGSVPLRMVHQFNEPRWDVVIWAMNNV